MASAHPVSRDSFPKTTPPSEGRAFDSAGHVLALDTHAVIGITLCRNIARRAGTTDIFAEPHSRAFRSRFCNKRIISPPLTPAEDYRRTVESVIREGKYEAVYICSEAVLETLLPLAGSSRLGPLPLSEPSMLAAALSKNDSQRIASEARVAIPRTIVPRDDADVQKIGMDLGFPLVVKGEKGEAGYNVRFVHSPRELFAAWHEISGREREYAGKTALQEVVVGPSYSVGGLFDRGRPLRICAHLKQLMVPPEGGMSARGKTGACPGLLDAAFRVFEAFRYTGLGHVEFVFDERERRLKFIEINPRVWGTIGACTWAGVDMFVPYRALANGITVQPDLRFREGVVFHQMVREARLMLGRPSRIPGFIADCLNPGVRSDFRWTDPLPNIPTIFQMRRFAKTRLWR